MNQHKKYLLTVVSLLLLALVSGAAQAQGCSHDAIHAAANTAVASRQRLLAIKVPDGIGTDVLTVPQMGASLLGMFSAGEPQKPQTSPTEQIDDMTYGRDLQVVVNRPETEPQLIAVKITFGIECGDDSMLLIYERHGETWKQSLRWQSDNYSEVSGSFGDFFEYAVLPQGQYWVVAVAHGMPWCTSRWSEFALDLIQPVRDGASQRVLQHISDGYVRFEKQVTMKYRPDGFEFRLEKGSNDVDLMTRTGIYRFHLANEKLERVQPIAMNGRDFVDEWLQVPWSDAQRWSDSVNLPALQQEHHRLAALRNPQSSKTTLFTYGPVRACSGDPKQFQVELDLNPGSTTYFQLIQGENSFTMVSAVTQPDARCKGADLMRK